MPTDSGAGERLEHDAAAHRFTLADGAAVAVLDYREHDSRTLEYYHTFVPPPIRGRGVASRLVEYALRYAREHGVGVIPTCPFVAAFVRKNSDYAPLLRR
jgi:uncharacterized protein